MFLIKKGPDPSWEPGFIVNEKRELPNNVVDCRRKYKKHSSDTLSIDVAD